MEKEFDEYWEAHKTRLLKNAPTQLKEERENSGKLNTMGDWMLMAFPVVVVVVFWELVPIKNELLNFVCSLVAGVIAYVLCEMVKPYVTGKRSVGDIDNDIKQHYYKLFQTTGKLDF